MVFLSETGTGWKHIEASSLCIEELLPRLALMCIGTGTTTIIDATAMDLCIENVLSQSMALVLSTLVVSCHRPRAVAGRGSKI